MNLQFSDTKDGFKTFSLDNVYFHSKYAPLTEAQRFAQSMTLPYKPKIIFLIEPGLSYCFPYIKDMYPDSKIVAIRLIDYDFPKADVYDANIIYKDCTNFKSYFLQTFGEEALLSSGIFTWPAAKNVFATQTQTILEQYKQSLNDCKTLLVTRQFFEKKWLTNCLNFIDNTKRFITLKDKIDLPVIVCASGPSLVPCLSTLKKNQNKVFIIALSSALSVLINYDITPDLVLSTDGGFWAGEHLKCLTAKSFIPLACPAEAYIPKKLLKKNPVLALEYDDDSSFISTQILNKCKITTKAALRNPTVSGTAIYFANSITDKPVYFLGLDLHENPGLQHSKPNELEKNNSITESRLTNKETRNTRSRFNSASLKIYEEWFGTINDSKIIKNTVRVIDGEFKNNTLGNIVDIDSKSFGEQLEELVGQQIDKNNYFTPCTSEITAEQKNNVYEYVLEQLDTSKWQKQIFPADVISCENSLDGQNERERLLHKIELLKNKIRKLQNV